MQLFATREENAHFSFNDFNDKFEISHPYLEFRISFTIRE